MQVLAPHIKITMIPAPAPEAEQGAAAATARPRARPDQEELVPHLEAFLKAHPEIKSQVKMAKVNEKQSSVQLPLTIDKRDVSLSKRGKHLFAGLCKLMLRNGRHT